MRAIALAIALLVVSTGLSAEVVEVARTFPDGGGYHWKSGSTGVTEPVNFRGECLVEATEEGGFCCGYTFAVAVRVAEERGLLDGKSVEDLKRFLKDWYGAPGGDKTLVVLAVENLGIGRAVPLEAAEPGDFVQLWRDNGSGEVGSGHSVIFLKWIKEDGLNVGFRYRSSQPATDGVGDRTEYFTDAAGMNGRVLREQTYACRLLDKPGE